MGIELTASGFQTGPPGRLSLDIETFSSVELSRSGVYRYAEAEDFCVLLVGYSFDFGPVRCVDLASGDVLPSELLLALLSPFVEKWAFNAAFERVCLSRLLRDMGYLSCGEFLSSVSWRCTMIWSAYLGLPMSLSGVGAVLGLDKQKLATGEELIRKFCKPVPRSFFTVGTTVFRNPPSADPERWKQFVEYNIRDVETEQGIQDRLSRYPVPLSVWQEYEQDQEINDRGIRVDRAFVWSAEAMDRRSSRDLKEQLARLTRIGNPNSVGEIRSWLSAHGQETESLSKKEVSALLASVPPEIREVLLLRQQLSKSSVRKYAAIQKSVCADGRVRGMFQFYGAARSGRWAGRLVQLQNLPQNHLACLSELRAVTESGDYEAMKMLCDSVPDALSELIRTAFVPAPGKKFIVCDFSAIEARIIAWLAGESWRQEVFASGGDIYCASASEMFHVPVEKHGVNAHLRQKGKIAELALGYGGGVGALKAMGALEMGVPESELESLVSAWRNANPNIVRLWWNVDKAVKTALKEKTCVSLFPLRFICRSGMLFIQLPSGRMLSYVKPHFALNRFGGESVCYKGTGTARKWETIESYGPKFVENIVQGIARDLLCHAMRGLSAMPGTAIVAHVHDEIILEADPGVTVEEVAARMAECPCWGSGLLLRADGYECEFYRKD